MPTKFKLLVRYAWLSLVIAWHESNLRLYDKQIAKQQRILRSLP